MKLSLSYKDLSSVFSTPLPDSDLIIESVSFDTRKIINGKHSLFFALKGDFRDGHDFIVEAHRKGVRTFVVSDAKPYKKLDAQFIEVKNPLQALQLLAKNHRDKFNYPIVGITGSAGKTITKEWLAQVLGSKFKVIRSPKSYNSQLGVALSLLELDDHAEIAIIEAGISSYGDMKILESMIQPTIGILTSIGSAHQDKFDSKEDQLDEKLVLFKNSEHVFIHDSINFESNDQRFQFVQTKAYLDWLEHLKFNDEISATNASIVIACSQYLKVDDLEIKLQLEQLERVALRLETFEGINNTTIINDPYNLDLDAFRSSLEYQLSLAKGKDRVVVVGTDENSDSIKQLLSEFDPITSYFVESAEEELEPIQNSIVLIKGKRSLKMERYAMRLRAKKHQTFVEIDLNAIKNNISYFKSKVPEKTMILTMVKASSYGSGIEKIGQFLDRIGINHLGVAYADEGVELRKAGVNAPILVMNSEESGFEDCIQYNLEPCIYSLHQLDGFIKRLIYEGKSNYPIHIKLETGMNRLGFQFNELPRFIEILRSQPEVKIQSVYSHLANSDDPLSNFTNKQVERFNSSVAFIQQSISYAFDKHILNSEGILNFPKHHFDMVRLGIGMYGYSPNQNHSNQLTPAIKWMSSVSQIKTVEIGESIGYAQKGIASSKMNIAVIPVGYADGFRRNLGNGNGGVYIQNQFCPVIGNVCMDMIMVELGNLTISEGETVEIIGENQSLTDLATKMDTITYEVLTGISKRVHRVYLED